MTIHWKALEEHFLMVLLVFRFKHFFGENAFFEFFSKTSILNPFASNASDSRSQRNPLKRIVDFNFVAINTQNVIWTKYNGPLKACQKQI
jgi:hypothetical protein